MRTCLARSVVLAVAALCVAGCGGTTTSPSENLTSSATSASSSASAAPAVGLIAIGHSALTGENSDPNHPHEPVLANSWATGTNSAVDSIYQRMIARWPETQGHVANTAMGGATADTLSSQADTALNQVPAPRLVIIETIDNDITCDGSDAGHVSDFGKSVDGALQLISQRSPKSRILLINQPGRPAADVALIEAMKPGVSKASFVQSATGPAPCGFYDDKGQLQPKNVAALTAIIEAYEAEQARVCAKYPTCVTTKAALRSELFRMKYVSADLAHRNIAGLAAIAKTVWPLVDAALK